MNKQDWMHEIERRYGWRDLWPGAWVRHSNGRWSRFETLADLWLWSDWLCPCCDEPLLITPDGNYLACRWTSNLTLFGQDNVYHLNGFSSLPCLRCYGRVWEERLVSQHKTTKARACQCGLSYVAITETTAIDFLPVGYVCRGWIEQSREDQISSKLDQIQLMLKEQKR